MSPRLSRRTPGRRRALAALIALAPVGIVVGAQSGAALGVSRTDDAARRERAIGDYARALATYRALAADRGPLFWMNTGPPGAASSRADDTLLEWATALARQGQAESALALVNEVQAPGPAASLRRQRVQILVEAARATSSSGDAIVALQLTGQFAGIDVPSDLRATAAAATTRTEVAAAPQLIAAGRASEAVAALDDVIRRDAHSADGQQAARLMPETLLAAGKLALTQFDTKEAAGQLTRLTAEYGSSAEAAAARDLLAAGQDVAGTVVTKDGAGVAGSVRLAAHFATSSRGDYALGPYFPGHANENGDFTIPSVPIGGPYVLEIQRDGAWVTPIDRDTGQPAYQTSVSALTPADLAFVVLPA